MVLWSERFLSYVQPVTPRRARTPRTSWGGRSFPAKYSAERVSVHAPIPAPTPHTVEYELYTLIKHIIIALGFRVEVEGNRDS